MLEARTATAGNHRPESTMMVANRVPAAPHTPRFREVFRPSANPAETFAGHPHDRGPSHPARRDTAVMDLRRISATASAVRIPVESTISTWIESRPQLLTL